MSSTFSDLKEERNALQREVFPKLRELCMEHGFRFQAIDLRWGVSEEAGLDQQTMKICLEEIERSQRVSPKPNFIVLLGNRYGWRPLPYEIPADEFEEIKLVIKDEDDRKFLFWEGDVLEDEQLKKRDGWYCRDENAVPPVYCLKPRFVDYEQNTSDEEIKKAKDLEYKDWENIEKRLKSLLLNAIDELDWDKNDPHRFKYESSATEQEIIKGVLNLPEDASLSEKHVFSFLREINNKKNISFDDNSKDFFDFNEGNELDESAETKLAELKAKIDEKIPSSNIFEYETEWEGKGVSKQHIKKLCDDVYSSLEKVINGQIDKFEDQNPRDIETESQKEFGKKRCKFFIGREDNRAKINNYLENLNTKPLIVYGKSGSGKSALMAKAAEDLIPDFYEIPVDNVIVRFIGATPESSDLRSLLESLSHQITKIYGENDNNIPTEYNELVQDFKERLNFATAEKPLFIFLDALDQLSDSENAHNLTWIPDELPENVHIVISTLKNIFKSSLEKRISIENTSEVLPLEKDDGRTILDSWLNDYRRKLTEQQETELISKFEVNGLPLYLKLAFEESKLWKSYTSVLELESDIKWMINFLFERLSRPENHGAILVSRSLGYLSAAKNGLTEDEMLDILALDDDVFSLTRKFHEPTEDKLPVALWSRFYFDLEPYLAERSADETSLMAFYHRQLGEAAREKYLNNTVKKSRHQIIAEYFYKQDLYFEQDEEKIYNVRKVSELPYQEVCGGYWKPIEDTLCDLRFVEAKCAVRKTYELIKDYNLALDLHPDAQEEKKKRLKYEKRVDKYVKDLIAYSKGEIDHLDIIPSVRPWTDEEIKKDKERIINNPYPLDHIKAFSQFVNSQIPNFVKFGYLPGFIIQQACNSANSGPVSATAKKIINEYSQTPLILKCENSLVEFNPHPELMKTLEGHASGVGTVVVTADGKKAVSGSVENSINVWDMETGGLIHTLKGHTKSVGTLAVTADGKKAISGSWDKTARVWNLDTGKELFALKGHTGIVEAVAVTEDGERAISASSDNTIKIWDIITGKQIHSIKSHPKFIDVVTVTPDSKKAISASIDNSLRIWDLETGKQIGTLNGHQKPIHSLAVTADGETVISGSWDGTIREWDLDSRRETFKIEEIAKTIKTVAVTANNKKAIYDRGYGAVQLPNLEIKSATGFLPLKNHMDPNEIFFDTIYSVRTAVGKKGISLNINNIIDVWDIETGKHLKTLIGHTKPIKSMLVTSDNKKAISGSVDKTVRVWDLDTGKELLALKGHCKPIETVGVTPDNKKIISASRDNFIIVWDLKTGEKLKTLKSKYMPIGAVVVTADGKKAISSSHNTLRVFDFETGKQQHEVSFNIKHPKGNLVVTTDGKRVIYGCGDGNVRVWDLETCQKIQTLKGHADEVNAISVPANGRKAITGSSDRTMRIWDLETGEELKKIKHNWPISTVAVTADGSKAISGGQTDTMILWDLKTGQQLKKLKGMYFGWTVAVTADGKKAISGHQDGTVRVWNLKKGQKFKTHKNYPKFLGALAVTADGTKAIAGSDDLKVQSWDLKTSKILNTFKNVKSEVVAVTSDSKKAILAHSGIQVWDLKTGLIQKSQTRNQHPIDAVVLTPDNKRAITKDFETLSLWDLETNQELKNIRVHTRGLFIDGKNAIFVVNDDTMRSWDLETGKVKILQKNISLNIKATTPDVKKAISANNNKIYLWDLKTGQILKIFVGHTDTIRYVKVTVDGKKAITSSNDKTIRVWDLETGKEIKQLKDDNHQVSSLDVTADNQRIISGSWDGSLRVWDLKTGEVISASKEDFPITSQCAEADGYFVFSDTNTGSVVFSRLCNIITGLPVITPYRLWLFNNKTSSGAWDDSIKADCPWCGNRFKIEENTINIIREIQNHYKKLNGWISDEAWEDTRLISECHECNQKIKFNPFIADNSEEKFYENFADNSLEKIAIQIHEKYVKEQLETGYKSLDDPSVQPWDELNETLKSSYLMQAQHIPEKLQKLYYSLLPAIDEPKHFQFSKEEIEILAEMEHQGWMQERIEDGWKLGDKDINKKNSPYLVPWEDLPDNIKEFDRDSVREIPEILKKAGFKIHSFKSNQLINNNSEEEFENEIIEDIYSGESIEKIAIQIHGKYVKEQLETGYKSLDDPSVQPWDELNETLKSSYLMQAQHIPEKLQKLHYNIRKVNDEPKYFKFSDEEIEILAEMEHERWFREKMEDGWTYNHEIDNELKNSPYLVPWEDLPDNIKEFDRDSVREIPEILKKAGFEIYSIL